MQKYTIGIVFSPDFKQVALIRKQRPDWQKGKINFPGGTCQGEEKPEANIVRKFAAETGMKIDRTHWHRIGILVNAENYTCDIFAAVHIAGIHGPLNAPGTPDAEIPAWYDVDALPDNVLSNLHWLVPFGINYFTQGNADRLGFGRFTYSN
jgi:8-oxo-dGTP diphosphatase